MPYDLSVSCSLKDNRLLRVFISSTFRDMVEERNELTNHTWPELRRLCQEIHVELVAVDLRWGIAEFQSTRAENLKLCLDETQACRPFFIGLLGERYGWIPGDDAFTADLSEEQPWLKNLHGKSVNELEILHGVLNIPDMAGRAFFYFRNPAYVRGRGPDFLSETTADAGKQAALKSLIRTTCAAKKIPLRENYSDPVNLAALVFEDLKAAIEAQFPITDIPDALTREAQSHEAFAEIRRRTYIGGADTFETLDRHASGEGGPLILLGDSGSGKSALLANWLAHWREKHPKDFIVQHYIGCTADSADHGLFMARVMTEIKRWSGDPDAVPTEHNDILKDFPFWLTKARAWAAHERVRLILALDALDRLDDSNYARFLDWLPEHPFTGPLRLIVSTLPDKPGTDDPPEVIQKRRWQKLRIQPLTVEERRLVIAGYLARFGKTLDESRLDRLASAAPAANPLYLKILLNDLRVTGTFDRFDQRLSDYLAAADIPAVLQQVLARYQRDYERDRKGLVAEALGLICAARRGLSESELLYLLRPANQAQLPPALWIPLRAALEDFLVDRGGVLNFFHDYLRNAAESAFAPDTGHRTDLRLRLANYFEGQPVTARTCDELPWLFWQTKETGRLRACLLSIDRFLEMHRRDRDELMRYWVCLKEERTMGRAYLDLFDEWFRAAGREAASISRAATDLAFFLHAAGLHAEAERLYRRTLAIWEGRLGAEHPTVARALNNLATLLKDTNRLAEAEPLMRRALAIDETRLGPEHPNVAMSLRNLALLLHVTNRLAEAEPLYRRTLAIDRKCLGPKHPDVATDLDNLAMLLKDTNRLSDAESLMRRTLAMGKRGLGPDHPKVAIRLNNLAMLLQDMNRLAEAEPLLRRALALDETSLGLEHPNVAADLNNLAQLLMETSRLGEAESLMRRTLAIDEKSFGPDHPDVAMDLNNLAVLLQHTNRLEEAEPMLRRALSIDETSLGSEHPNVARDLNNLALLLQDTNRRIEAEPLMRRALAMGKRSFGRDHPKVAIRLNNLAMLLQDTNRMAEAEPLMRRALAIDETSLGPEHPTVARDLNNLAQLLKDTDRLEEAETLMRHAVMILMIFMHKTGYEYPCFRSYRARLSAMQTSRSLFNGCGVLFVFLALAALAFFAWCVLC